MHRTLKPTRALTLRPRQPKPTGYLWFQKRSSTIQAIEPVQRDVDAVTRDEFLQHRQDEVPFVLKREEPLDGRIPHTIAKWFEFRSRDKQQQQQAYARSYLSDLGHTPVTYELTLTPSVERFISSLQSRDLQSSLLSLVAGNATSGSSSPFLRFTAPLDLFIAALHYNNSQSSPADRLTSLYIAQSSISGLPRVLQEDLAPPPAIDPGNIYNSSIWLGLTPTYTPLHRDPNPNLFRQLHGAKVVRILPPRAGETVFRKIQSSIGGSASSRLRGEEMMYGPEKAALHDAIWAGDGGGSRTIHEARLGAGDALYLPEGWWHSLKSAAADLGGGPGGEGELNVSVNWWFRSAGRK
ncbi:Clavaminate synthase-like protein [Coniochaeta hoffmannii]|uniref:Clavaminate synthase-like protein n=1 Tax=Coniochaeta hoffmannii TaxID=91930 RepID=A0AA38R102_9PEZI|nr:Clavaminate synthase-like protein [Coniochaeta hoffmannii]